jgi:hypothetical protein
MMGAERERIDIVYLWVDGADAAWRKKKERALAAWSSEHSGELAMYGDVEGRYRNNDELRFSLRALERFFPDHGKVWIVTDDQRPAWLRETAGVKIVDHRDLIPAELLPVFSSTHIESWIHRIPGLSERFFYLNDDVFFGAPVIPELWFGKQLTLFVEAQAGQTYNEIQPHETSLVNAAILARDWLASRYADYQHDARLFAHTPRPLLKSALYELEELAPEMFARVRSSPFRSWHNPPIISDLLLRWMVHTGRARREVAPNALYISTGSNDAPLQFARLRARFESLPYFCINDTCDDAPPNDVRLLRIARILPELLPDPSCFESRNTKFDEVLGALASRAVHRAPLSSASPLLINDRESVTQD